MPPARNEVTYATLEKDWPGAEVDHLSISYAPGGLDLVVALPRGFLDGLDFVSNQFVEHVAQQLVEEPGLLREKDARDEVLDPAARPTAGEYVFVPVGEENVRFTEFHGPENKRSRRLAAPTFAVQDEPELASHSSGNATEDSFRGRLLTRDGRDYFSRATALFCVATHLVPPTRPDIYENLRCDPFATSSGLLIDSTAHLAYEHYMWSLYHKDGLYFFVCFDPTVPPVLACHGTFFTSDDCRSTRADLPNLKLINWHFRQCVLKNVRGYSVRMAINAE
ncbi:hypothetical protein JCM10207_006771 [Rhodosporidiobolus poonsookiae]